MRVFVNSIHKSGTNLVEKLVRLAEFSRTGRSLALSSVEGPWAPVRKLLRGSSNEHDRVAVGLESPAFVRRSWLTRYLDIPGGQYVSGHAPFSAALARTLANRDFRVLQIYRDPRSVLVSWANYCVDRSMHWYPFYRYLRRLSFEDRVLFFLHGGEYRGLPYFGFRQVIQRTAGWLNDPNTLPLRYEDLVGAAGGGDDASQRATLTKALDFIGVPADTTRLSYIQSSLYGGTHTFRQGRIDGWREVLSAELAKEIEVACAGSELRELGYDFD